MKSFFGFLCVCVLQTRFRYLCFSFDMTLTSVALKDVGFWLSCVVCKQANEDSY